MLDVRKLEKALQENVDYTTTRREQLSPEEEAYIEERLGRERQAEESARANYLRGTQRLEGLYGDAYLQEQQDAYGSRFDRARASELANLTSGFASAGQSGSRRAATAAALSAGEAAARRAEGHADIRAGVEQGRLQTGSRILDAAQSGYRTSQYDPRYARTITERRRGTESATGTGSETSLDLELI